MDSLERTIYIVVATALVGAAGAISYLVGWDAAAKREQCWVIAGDVDFKVRLYMPGSWRSGGSLHNDASAALEFARRAGYVLCATTGAAAPDGGEQKP